MRCSRYMTAGVIMLGAGALFAQETATPTPPATRPAPPATGGRGGTESPAPQYWFGVAVQNLPRAISRQLKLAPDQGLMVMMVLPDSPAQKAQLRPEDVLIEIDGIPLTSYEELARAANRPPPTTPPSQDAAESSTRGKIVAALLPNACQLTLLREGDRKTVTILPAPRPRNMLAVGANLTNFTLAGPTSRNAQNRSIPGKSGGGGMKTIVLSNGITAQVGPGFVMDEASTVNIRHMVESGQTVTFTQEFDAAGAARHRLTVGNKSYAVDPAKIDALPEDLRPVARQMLASMPTPSARPDSARPPATRPSAPPTSPALERRIQDLERQNQALREENRETQRKLDRLLELLEDKVNQ
jgi:hypothetical protein